MKNSTRRLIRRTASRIVYPPARLMYGLNLRLKGIKINVEGAENLPGQGPCIIVPNHQDYYDTPVLGLALGKRPEILQTWIMGDFAGNSLVKSALPLFGAIKIYRPEIDLRELDKTERRTALEKTRASLEEFDFGLQQGDHFVVFAEENFYVGGIGPLKPGFFKRVAQFEADRGEQVAFAPVGIEYKYVNTRGQRLYCRPETTKGVDLSTFMKTVDGKMIGADIRFGKVLYRGQDGVQHFMERIREEMGFLSNSKAN